MAGQPDLLMKDGEGRVIVVDWKRSRAIHMENERTSLKFPLQHLPQTNYWMYALQLNLYAYCLETQYGFRVGGYYLAVVHPDASGPRLISCPRMDAEMRAIHAFEEECGRATASMPGVDAPFVLL